MRVYSRMSRPALLLALLSFTNGCGAAPAPDGQERPSGVRAASPAVDLRDCGRIAAPASAGGNGSRESSTLALGDRSGRPVAYVADTDGRAIHVVDVESGEVRSAAVDGAPEHLLVLDDGRVMTTISDGRRVEVYQPAAAPGDPPIIKRCERTVPPGPFALAVSEDGASVAVTSAWGAALTVLDGDTLEPRRVVSLPRSPRGVSITAGRAYVTHLAGSQLSVVDLATGPQRSIPIRTRAASPEGDKSFLQTDREAGQAYALASVSPEGSSAEAPAAIQGAAPPGGKARSSRLVVPMVSIDPGDERRTSSIYYGPPPLAGISKHAPTAAVVDPAAERSLTTHTLAPTWDLRAGECTLPRAIAVDPEAHRGFVACMGIDQVHVVDVAAADPMAAVIDRIDAPTGPTGLALSRERDKIVIYGELSSRLRIVDLESRGVRDVDLPVLVGAKARRGRELFYASDDRGISSDGLACASCHPDGGDDGLTWTTPEGPRQTPMLAGRLKGTAPYGWSRGAHDLPGYITETVARLGGAGLSRGDLDALAAYVEALPAPPRPDPGSLAAAGREVFVSEGCASCHIDIEGTDARLHAVGAGRNEVDTPSLRHVGATSPYFHDGRYRTLESLLTHSDMGRVPSLTADQRASLVAFLESL